MKTDRELLVLASKALGNGPLDFDYPERDGHGMYLGPRLPMKQGVLTAAMWTYWNPLDDDGDASHLAVALGIGQVHHQGWGQVMHPSLAERIDFEYGNDKFAATRRAIVLAAAIIGAAMERGLDTVNPDMAVTNPVANDLEPDQVLFELEWRKKFAMPTSVPFSQFKDGRYDAPAINDCFEGWRMARSLARDSQPIPPAGFRFAPLEPTLKMIGRGRAALYDPRTGQEVSEMFVKRCYAHMLCVAPLPASGPVIDRPAPKETNVSEEVPCSTHPDAPHGFDRMASHSLGRYVCDCEGWTP